MKRTIFILIFCASVSLLFGQQKSCLKFNTEFEGGNGFIEKISNDTVWITPDTRNIIGDWFYWAIEVISDTDRDLTFCLPPYKIPAFGVAYSLDNGENWNWSKQDEEKYIHSFSLHLYKNKPIRLSMGFPYTNSNWNKFVKGLDSDVYVIDTLCMTAKDQAVPMMKLGSKSKGKDTLSKPKVVITARHHACEMMTNYVLEGMIKSFVSNDKDLIPFLEKYEVLIIPFVDYEGVQNGDQGKSRYPRDHNRDYSGKSIYSTTNAIREFIPRWAQDNLALVIDMHCPGIWGKEHELIHIVGSKVEKFANAETLFASYLAKYTTGKELLFDETAILYFGTSWNNDQSEIQGDSFKTWCQKQFPNSKLACSLEVPYATNKGQKITIENLNEFGRAMSYAISDFLEDKSY